MKFQHFRHECIYRRNSGKAEYVHCRTSEPNQNRNLSISTLHRRHTNEQCHRHAVPFSRETPIPIGHHIEKRDSKDVQANLECSSEAQYPAHTDTDLRRYLLGGRDRKFYDRQLAGRDGNHRDSKLELKEEGKEMKGVE